ncbi:probable RNA polymerase II nuclear localization protein SLC7A6OS [Frieseomelitta varia]|uniref:probable RNA polymerase II nuclear localization protein SLC7A6OS n=1 Tax=Frieseomelitta varia TaxID=561572 RepID=UPI001CB69393|nr:probable RNA polymerase II nuclear localization protein SLC7A6OS [Frieseomelitta varia]
MTAILRVKRRYDDEPLNALVISCKRQKIVENEEAEDASSVPLTTFAKFAGTVKQHDENVEHLIQTYAKNEGRMHSKQHFTDVLNKIRETTKQASAENRYKVVNCFRSLDNSNAENSEETVVTVIDVEDSKSIIKDSVEKDDNYVYDLYYVQTENDMYLDEDVCVHPFNYLVHDTYENNGYPEAEYDSEDSNSESNWRNDYPDSDSEGSIDEDDIRAAIMNMRLEDESDLSEEDDFIYAVDESDVDAYGYKYARYKARMKQELKEDDDDDDDHLSGLSINVSENSDEECSEVE